MKRLMTYLKNDTVFLFPQSYTDGGLFIGDEPMVRISASESLPQIGAAVIRGLQHSRESIPHPTDMKVNLNRTLDFLGVRTWSAFAKGASCCAVERDSQGTRLIPYVPAERGSFAAVPDQTINCEPEPNALAQSLLDCLKEK